MNINQKIFRLYDVRGVYKKDIDEDVFYTLGEVFASHLGKGRVVVGRDIRSSSQSLSEAFMNGVLDNGLDVADIGVVTTPMFYFGVKKLGGAGGAMITASHNPMEFNGIKFTDKDAQPVSGVEIKKLFEEFIKEKNKKRGRLEKVDISDDYLNLIAKDFKLKRKIKVNIDARDSTVNLFLERFLKKMKVESYSGHVSDFGISFDTDGDRLKVRDEDKNELRGDIVGGIIADGFLQKGDTMICDLVSTGALKDYFHPKEINVIKSRVGHYFIKKKMKETDAIFGSEISGHYYFKSLNYVESALFAFRKILEALDKNPDKKISESARPFQKYFHSGEINLPCRQAGLPISSKEEWEKILEKIKEKYKGGQQNFEDGILMEYKDPAAGGASWWFNLRPSNTEPLIRLVVEAESRELMEEKKKELLDFLSLRTPTRVF